MTSPVHRLATPDAPVWWVIHTRPRCEKKMDQWLASRGMEHFLPARPKVRIYPSKKVTFEHPLFAGYAFGAFSLRQRVYVLDSGHAAGVLDVLNQAQLLSELGAVRRALEMGAPLEECPYISVGQRARITAGPCRGLEGHVERTAGNARFMLSVEFLQRSVAMEVDSSMLELAA